MPPPPPVIEYKPDNWKEFSSAEGRFAILVPGVPTLTTIKVETAIGTIDLHNYALATDTAFYLVSYGDFPIIPVEPEAIRKALDGGRDNMLAKGKNQKLISETEFIFNGQITREWFIHRGDFIARFRAFFIKGRLYQIAIGTPLDMTFKTGQPSANPQDRTDFYEATANKFFDSFKPISNSQESAGEVDRLMLNDKVVVLGSKDSSDTSLIGELLNGRAITLPKPVYPAVARAARASGTVIVKVVIDEEGKVIAAQAHSGHPLLQAAAVKAAREALFTPTLLEGKPVKVAGAITYNFVP